MGIKLMVEIFDHWQDAGLTVGERSDLLVLAENANDGTRQTFGPVHAEYILRRAGKTAASWRVAINKLMKKKVLEYATKEGRELRGHTGQSAVYRLVPLCSSPPHSGHKGLCARPASTGGGEGHLSSDPSVGYPADNAVKGETPGEGYPAATPGEPSDNPVGGVGYPADTEWVSAQITPTPPYPSFKTPSTTSSTSSAEASSEGPVTAGPSVTDGGGGGSDLRSLAIHIADSLDYKGKPPTRKQRQTIEDRLLVFLEADWSLDELVVHLDLTGQAIRYAPAVYIDRLDPVELSGRRPSPPPQAPVGGVRGDVLTAAEIEALTVDKLFSDGRPAAPPETWAEAQQRLAGVGSRGGTDATVAGWDAVKRELAGREHRPYSNPQGDSVYDEPWPLSTADRRAAQGLALAAKYRAEEERAAWPQWCGEPECEPIGRMREHVDANGLKYDEPCPRCHPDRARAA